MNKTTVAIVFIGIAVVIAGFSFLQSKSKSAKETLTQTDQTAKGKENTSFESPKKAAHYESNTPEHGAILAGVPINVVINFNFDLATDSGVRILKDGKDYSVGATKVDDGNLTLRKDMDQEAPDGIYTVDYRACWQDKSCHDGAFQFKIDRKLQGDFTDWRNLKEVTIDLKNIAFNPQKIRVSPGTKVTWVNNDNIEHTVNTDSHPAHTYFPTQNSRTLENGDTYTVTFDTSGIYLYHCTPHASTMQAQILVD